MVVRALVVVIVEGERDGGDVSRVLLSVAIASVVVLLERVLAALGLGRIQERVSVFLSHDTDGDISRWPRLWCASSSCLRGAVYSCLNRAEQTS